MIMGFLSGPPHKNHATSAAQVAPPSCVWLRSFAKEDCASFLGPMRSEKLEMGPKTIGKIDGKIGKSMEIQWKIGKLIENSMENLWKNWKIYGKFGKSMDNKQDNRFKIVFKSEQSTDNKWENGKTDGKPWKNVWKSRRTILYVSVDPSTHRFRNLNDLPYISSM